jgi:hypothetical protein
VLSLSRVSPIMDRYMMKASEGDTNGFFIECGKEMVGSVTTKDKLVADVGIC